MRVPVWAHDLAQHFWSTLDAVEPFPRTLETSAETYGVAVQRLAGLTVDGVRAWLATQHITLPPTPSRALAGCLVADGGRAFVFVDAADAVDEQRFTLAHELAHYLRDVCRPRRQVERTLGLAGLDVADRRRPATMAERLTAALTGVRLDTHVHWLARGADGLPATAASAEGEDCADVLAFELLAPAAHLAHAGASGWTDAELRERLRRDYGLPAPAAAQYALRLRPKPHPVEPWLKALRAAL